MMENKNLQPLELSDDQIDEVSGGQEVPSIGDLVLETITGVYQCSRCAREYEDVYIPGSSPRNCPACGAAGNLIRTYK